MRALGTETQMSKEEAKRLVRGYGLRLPRAGHLVRVIRPAIDHHFGLYDLAIFRRAGRWVRVNVVD